MTWWHSPIKIPSTEHRYINLLSCKTLRYNRHCSGVAEPFIICSRANELSTAPWHNCLYEIASVLVDGHWEAVCSVERTGECVSACVVVVSKVADEVSKWNGCSRFENGVSQEFCWKCHGLVLCLKILAAFWNLNFFIVLLLIRNLEPVSPRLAAV